MKKNSRMAWVLALAVWALLLAPFFLGARAAHPATDDFTFALYTHRTWAATGSLPHVLKDALSYAMRTWRDWQGTITGVLLMTLSPIVFSLESYGMHAVLLLALDLVSWFVFFRHMLGTRLRLPRKIVARACLLLTGCQLLFLPDIVEGIYWFNGAWFYTGAQAIALLTLTLADHWAASEKRSDAWQGALCALLLLALGMDNYITAMMILAALFFMAAQRAFAGEKRAALRTAALIVPLAAGLAVSVLAPGNRVRMETDGAHQSGLAWLVSSVMLTLQFAVHYIVRFSTKTPLLALLAAGLPRLSSAAPERGAKMPPIWATIAGFYLILCAMIIPHMYSSGYAGSGRVVNMYHDYVLCALPVAAVMIVGRLSPKTRARIQSHKGRAACLALAAAALATCLAGGQIRNYAKLVSDQFDGTQTAYIAQFEREYALCQAAGEEDEVVLPAWTVQTMTGKPTAFEDPSVWTNESMAGYFGVKSVRAEKNDSL